MHLLIPDQDHLLDISAFKVVDGQPKLPKTKTKSVEDGPERHGDAGIAYLCAHIASIQPIVQYEYNPATDKNRDKPLTSRPSTAARLKVKKGGLL